jgi:hypothetical protein
MSFLLLTRHHQFSHDGLGQQVLLVHRRIGDQSSAVAITGNRKVAGDILAQQRESSEMSAVADVERSARIGAIWAVADGGMCA